MPKLAHLFLTGVALVAAAACQPSIPREALTLHADSLERRSLQTRRFETEDEGALLSACAAVMQDLGFNISESHSPLGLVVGQKERDATEVGQIAGAVVLLIFTTALGAPVWIPTDKDQTIRASIVTRKLEDERKGTAARITFQRIVRNTAKEVSKIEALDDPKIYQEFFERLSKAVFLEAQAL